LYKKLSIGVVVPAYNEEKLILKTLSTLPTFVDHVVVVNDASTDNTLRVVKKYANKDPRVTILNNTENHGLGYGLKKGLKKGVELGCDRLAIMAGDAQMDPDYLNKLLDAVDKYRLDYVKANRFMDYEALQAMPKYRKFGNILVTMLTKFATGYYTIFDTQNGYAVYTKDVVERIPWPLVGDRYEYENTILIALSIINAKVKDYPIPAIYGQEKSTIKLFSTVSRVLKILFFGFWKRIYYKYVIYGFHPIALFVLAGTVLNSVGVIAAIYLLVSKIAYNITPSAASVMLVALPLILGMQMFFTALILDVIEEKR